MRIQPLLAVKVTVFAATVLAAIGAAVLPYATASEPAKAKTGAEPAKTKTAAETAKTHTVAAGGFKLNAPGAWVVKQTKSNVHLMQFTVPKTEGDKHNAHVSVWYVVPSAGSTDENIQRLVGQFEPKNRKVKLTSGKCADGNYVLADISGTWNQLVSSPQSGDKIVQMKDARVLGLILFVEHQGGYFVRLTGPQKTVAANVDAFRAAIGADAKSEKDYASERKVTARKVPGKVAGKK